jgi:LacI family transcriptional regulator
MNPFAFKVAILIPDTANHYFADLAQYVQRFVTSANGLGVIFSSDGRRDVELRHVGALAGFGFDGIVFVSVGDNFRVYEELVRLRLPHVVLDREVPESGWCDFVLSDNVLGSRFAAEHLISLRHEAVAYLAGDQRTEPGRARLEAFQQAFLTAGKPLRDNAIMFGDFSFKSGYDCGKRLAGSTSDYSAIACGNDLMAIGVLQALQESGVAIPTQISVVGYDDIPCASWIYPRLTTVRQEVSELARHAVDVLVSRIDQQRDAVSTSASGWAPTLRSVPPRLIARESCRPNQQA